MKNHFKSSYLVFILISSHLLSMEHSFSMVKVEYGKLNPQKKLEQKKLLMSEIYRLRSIRRDKGKNFIEFLNLEKKFKAALIARNVSEMEVLLDQTIGELKIDVNKSINFEIEKKQVRSLPLVFAACVKADLDMVKVLLKYGAQLLHDGHSLIHKMLEDLNQDEAFWAEHLEKMMQIRATKYRNDFLIILEYLLDYSGFDKNYDEENCAEIWDKILRKVNALCRIGSESFYIIARITSKFFSDDEEIFHDRGNLRKDYSGIRSKRKELTKEGGNENPDLTQVFAQAVLDQDIEKVEGFLKMEIDADQPIEYDNGNEIECELPIIIAIIKNLDLKMVELFDKYGFSIPYPEVIIHRMLNTFLEKSFYVNKQNYNETLEKNLTNFFVMLNYLLSYSEFEIDENKYTKKIAEIWAEITSQVDLGIIFLCGEPLSLILKITEAFFKHDK